MRFFALLLLSCGAATPAPCELVGDDFVIRYTLTDAQGDCPFAEVTEHGPVKLTSHSFEADMACPEDNSVSSACIATYNGRCSNGSVWMGSIDVRAGHGWGVSYDTSCRATFDITVRRVP